MSHNIFFRIIWTLKLCLQVQRWLCLPASLCTFTYTICRSFGCLLWPCFLLGKLIFATPAKGHFFKAFVAPLKLHLASPLHYRDTSTTDPPTPACACVHTHTTTSIVVFTSGRDVPLSYLVRLKLCVIPTV